MSWKSCKSGSGRGHWKRADFIGNALVLYSTLSYGRVHSVIHQRQLRQQKHPTVFGFSPSVWPKPRDWGDYIDVTGYWFLKKPADWQPPANLDQRGHLAENGRL
jgi:hypothetical protein